MGIPPVSSSSFCTAPAASCIADTFLYIGSDIDVSILTHMQPQETRAIFVDNFQAADRLGPNTEWLHEHMHDERAAYRQTSAFLRPLDKRNASQIQLLQKLVLGRLKWVPGVQAARVLSDRHLEYSFTLFGIGRSLSFVIAEAIFEAGLSRRCRFDGIRLSTLAFPGKQPVLP